MKIGKFEIPNRYILYLTILIIIIVLKYLQPKKEDNSPELTEKMTQKNNNSIHIVYGVTCPYSLTFMGENIAKGRVGNEAKKLMDVCIEKNIKCSHHESQTKEAMALRKKYNLKYVPSIVLSKGDHSHVIVGANLTTESILDTFENLEKIKEEEKKKEGERKKLEKAAMENAKTILNQSKSGKELIVYYGPWCYYSRLFVGKDIVPIYDGKVNNSEGEVKTINTWAKQNDYKFTLVNHKVYPQEAKNDGAKGYPHTVIKKDGTIIGSVGGYLPANKFINKLNQETSPKRKQSESGNKIIIIYAPWCIWSKRLCGNQIIKDYNGSFKGRGPKGEYPTIKSECNKRGYEVELVDATVNKRRANQLGANGFPNILKMTDGNIVDTIGGYMPADQIMAKFFN